MIFLHEIQVFPFCMNMDLLSMISFFSIFCFYSLLCLKQVLLINCLHFFHRSIFINEPQKTPVNQLLTTSVSVQTTQVLRSRKHIISDLKKGTKCVTSIQNRHNYFSNFYFQSKFVRILSQNQIACLQPQTCQWPRFYQKF